MQKFTFFVILIVITTTCQLTRGDQIDAILDETYDGRLRPEVDHDGKPLLVKVRMTIEDIEDVDDDEQQLTIGIELQETWLDSRLDRTKDNRSLPSLNPLVDDANRIWGPETHFANSKDTIVMKNVQKITVDGQVTKLVQARITATCQMNFFYFPFDRHICTFKIFNLEYSNQQLTYAWNDGQASLHVEPDVSKTRMFNFAGYRLGNYSSSGLLGNHSGLEAKLFLTRKSERSFPVFYFPPIALVIIGLVSLFFGSTLLGIALSFSCFITMIIFSVLIHQEMPTYYEMTMLDHYHFVSLHFILNTFIINILVYGYLNPSVKTPSKSPSQSGTIELKNLNGVNGNDVENNKEIVDDPEEHIHNMSKFKQSVYFKGCKPAKFHMPIGFVLVNVIYWLWILIATFSFPPGFQKLSLKH